MWSPRPSAHCRAKLGEVGWLACQLLAPPCFEVSRLQQNVVTATVQDLVDCNKLIRRAKNCEQHVHIPCLRLDELVVGAVSDAFHGNVRDGASQAGWMVLLMNPEVQKGVGSVFCVAYASHRIRRIVRSTLAAETMGLATAVESGDYVRACLMELTDGGFTLRSWYDDIKKWPQLWVVDARSTYDHLNKDCGIPTDKRLAIDVAALHETLARGGDRLVWVPGPVNPADGLTKAAGTNEALESLQSSGCWTLVETEESALKRAAEAERRRLRKLTAKEK